MNSLALNLPGQKETQDIAAHFSAPRYVWVDDAPANSNTFVIFRRNIVLVEQLHFARICLFADTRYRLRVNGKIVGYGPCRFHPRAPQYDEYDLAPFLTEGRNCITVEVNHRGENSFQASPSAPGFIAWGSLSDGQIEIPLETPGNWEVCVSNAWVREAPVFSFALPSVEMLDLSQLPGSLFTGAGPDDEWHSPKCVASESWGNLAPRTAPVASGEMCSPNRAVFVGSLRSEEQQVMFHRRFEFRNEKDKNPFLCFAIWLHSPLHQDVELGTFWGRHFVNGKELRSRRDNSRGNREITSATLEEGWNLLFGEIEIITPSWGFTVGWPRQANLTFAATPSLDDTATLLISDPISHEELSRLQRPAGQSDLKRLNGFFSPVSLSAANCFPARECAWHAAGTNVAVDSDIEFPLEMVRSEQGEGAVVFDFKREWIGHPMLTIECDAPCVLDIANDEALRQDGLLRFYESLHLTNNVDRYWLPAGKHRIESFHERGGRYLQITARSAAPVTIHSVAIRSALIDLPRVGSFHCSDPTLNWIWETGIDTLQASMTDGWIDPWREQGCYLGDVYVEWLATRMYSPDLKLIRRCLQLWQQCQREDGQMPAVVPAHYTSAHPDYTLTWVLLLRDYLRWTHDLETVRGLWPTVEKLWCSPLWRQESTGLWDATGINLFCDWGATPLTRECSGNLLLNSFRVGALLASAEIASAIGSPARSQAYKTEAREVSEAIEAHLWNSDRDFFSAGLQNGNRLNESSVHGNILALLFHIPSPENEAMVLKHVLDRLRHDIAHGDAGKHDGHCDFYFLNFALTMLHERGLQAEAFELIRDYWGKIQARGALTFPETWPHETEGVGSYCHGWACSPLISITSQLLGVKPIDGVVLISPYFAPDVDSVCGTYPHERGEIKIEWSRKAQVISLKVDAPRGVATIDVPQGVSAKLLEY